MQEVLLHSSHHYFLLSIYDKFIQFFFFFYMYKWKTFDAKEFSMQIRRFTYQNWGNSHQIKNNKNTNTSSTPLKTEVIIKNTEIWKVPNAVYQLVEVQKAVSKLQMHKMIYILFNRAKLFKQEFIITSKR